MTRKGEYCRLTATSPLLAKDARNGAPRLKCGGVPKNAWVLRFARDDNTRRQLLRVGAVGTGVEFEGRELNFFAGGFPYAVADFLDGRSDDGGGELGGAKFQVHAAADVWQLEHGAAPGRTGDRHLHWLGTKFRMAGDKRLAAAQQHGGVAVVHGLNLQDGRRGQIVDENSAFDLRADDAAVHFVGEVGMGVKHTDARN